MFGVALLSSALLALVDARIYERCELARDLLSLGVQREHLATWVCIAFHESRYDTAARNPYSGDHGILQISELYWCGAGKVCGVPCSALRDDDIADDVDCALQIYKEHTRLQGNGFLAWVVYPQHCKHNAKKYLADCESSVKTSSVRTDGRARVLKPQNRNVTNFLTYPKVDELLPPYLAIGSVFGGNYEREFEQNYNNKVKVDWLNYKIDNIDELKLPVFNQRIVGQYPITTLATTRRRTKTTTTTTTTTTPSLLPKIKPPSPRKIESNSFRRKKLRPIFEPFKFVEKTDSSTISLSTISPRNIYISSTKNSSKQDNLPKSTIKASIPFTTTTPTITTTTTTTTKPLPTTTIISSTTTPTTNKPSTKNFESFSWITGFTSATAKQETTNSPTVYTAKPVLTMTTLEVSTERTPRTWFTTSSIDQNSSTRSIKQSLSLNTTKSSFPELKDSFSVNNKSIAPITFTSTSVAPTASDKINSFNFYKSQSLFTTLPGVLSTARTTTTSSPWTWRTWRTTSRYTAATSTSKPPSSTRRTENTSSRLTAQSKENISTKQSQFQSTTPNPWSRTRAWHELTVPTKLWGPSNITNSVRTFVQSTTSRPSSTTPTFRSRSTANPNVVATSRTSTVTSTKRTSPTTTRSTQSIFDLYLNPTKRPAVSPFSFKPFKRSGLGLIFAGGTTTHAPTFIKSDSPKSALQDTAKN